MHLAPLVSSRASKPPSLQKHAPVVSERGAVTRTEGLRMYHQQEKHSSAAGEQSKQGVEAKGPMSSAKSACSAVHVRIRELEWL